MDGSEQRTNDIGEDSSSSKDTQKKEKRQRSAVENVTPIQECKERVKALQENIRQCMLKLNISNDGGSECARKSRTRKSKTKPKVNEAVRRSIRNSESTPRTETTMAAADIMPKPYCSFCINPGSSAKIYARFYEPEPSVPKLYDSYLIGDLPMMILSGDEFLNDDSEKSDGTECELSKEQGKEEEERTDEREVGEEGEENKEDDAHLSLDEANVENDAATSKDKVTK